MTVVSLTRTPGFANGVIYPDLLNGVEASFPSNNRIVDLPGGGMPDVDLYAGGSARGVFTFLFQSHAKAFDCFLAHQGPATWVMQHTDFYFFQNFGYVVSAGGEVRIYQDDERLAWFVEVPFTEIS